MAYVDRLTKDYRTTFGTAAGKHVLMDLYGHCHGKDTTFPPGTDSHGLALNEGKRWAYLRIMGFLSTEDDAAREAWAEHMNERRIEEEHNK